MNMNHFIVNLSNELGLIHVSGEGAKKFLQGQLTCNLDDISSEFSSLAAHCNPQGRIISLFRLVNIQDQYFLQLPHELIPIALAALKKYAVFFKVSVTDISHSHICAGYNGDALHVFFENLAENSNTVAIRDQVIATQLSKEQPRYQIMGEKNAVSSFISLLQSQAAVTTPLQWKALNIAAGIPAVYPETSEKFLPHDLNLQMLNAISFNKGCYTGQEIIARMQYRGKLKNHLYLAKAQSIQPPKIGGEIMNATQTCGNIVDYAEVGYNNYQLLVIAPEADVKTTPLFLDPERKVILEFLAG